MKNKLLIYILIIATFAVNTPLSIVGIILQISQYFHTNIGIASLYVSSFSLIVSISGLFLPLFFSKFERRKLFLLILTIYTISNLISIFATNIYIALICRILPAFFYSAFVSIILTVVEEIAPKNKKQEYISWIMIGVSAGSILGLPITTFFGTNYGYPTAMLWFTLINLISLILFFLYFPQMPGKIKTYSEQISNTKSLKFIIATLSVFILTVGVSISYNHFSYYLQTVTNIHTYFLSIILLIYGLLSIIGTYISGKILNSKPKLFVLLFPIILALATLALFVSMEFLILTILVIFIWGILDGCVDNVLQYNQVSALPEAPEFSNGIFLSMLNIGIATGTSIGAYLILGFGVSSIFIASIIVLFLSFTLTFIRFKFLE